MRLVSVSILIPFTILYFKLHIVKAEEEDLLKLIFPITKSRIFFCRNPINRVTTSYSLVHFQWCLVHYTCTYNNLELGLFCRDWEWKLKFRLRIGNIPELINNLNGTPLLNIYIVGELRNNKSVSISILPKTRVAQIKIEISSLVFR